MGKKLIKLHTSKMYFNPMQAVHPATGDVLYDEFTDTTSSTTLLDTRMTHLQPVELIHPQHLSEGTLQTLQYWHHQKIKYILYRLIWLSGSYDLYIIVNNGSMQSYYHDVLKISKT